MSWEASANCRPRVTRTPRADSAYSSPMNIAIAGRPNVGKSALFNRIAGRRIAIVHGQPGITRDRISAKCEIGGKTFRLWDTGGIVGAGETQLKDQVRASAELAMAESDLILLVVDGRDGVNPMDRELAPPSLGISQNHLPLRYTNAHP